MRIVRPTDGGEVQVEFDPHEIRCWVDGKTGDVTLSLSTTMTSEIVAELASDGEAQRAFGAILLRCAATAAGLVDLPTAGEVH